MSHLDEGTLHALLDGELETTEVAGIQAHLSSCSACGLRLREVKEFLAEADRLIASVDLGIATVAAGALPGQREATVQPEPVSRPEPAARPEPPARREPVASPPRAVAEAEREPWNEAPPILLFPDNESPAERRMRRMQRAGWAALLVALVGAGFLGVRLRPQGADLPPLTRVSQSDAVVSPEEASRPAWTTDLSDSSSLAKAGEAPRAAAARPTTTPPAPRAPVQDNGRRASGQGELALQSRAERQADPAPARADRSIDEEAIDSAVAASAASDESELPAGEDLATVRERASQALEELDLERRRDQAAAATAALDAERRRRAAAPPATAQTNAAPTPPAPPTMEQRAQVYLRIGLDEASRQLGGPAHVIEGLSPMFMGLARGAGVGGADATRPVVRVVYQDAQGRLILLDQQRLRTGQAAPPAGPLAWLIGDTAMWLRGEANADILRTYRPRVR